MRRSIALVTFAALVCLAVSAADRKPDSRSSGKQSVSQLAEQVRQLTEALQQQQLQSKQQQEQINQLQQQLQSTHAQVERQSQELGKSSQATTERATALEEKVESLKVSAQRLETSAVEADKTLANAKSAIKNLENPLGFHYKGLTITPGGFLSADVVVRSRNQNADVTSSFGATPFGGVANSHLSEFRFSARQSRPTVLAEGMIGKTKLSGYYEVDFLGEAPTANQVQTNSFTPRQRQLWFQADMQHGWTITAGQFWSLITTNRKGIATRAEFIPTTFEGSYVVGYNYVRQAAFRLTKNLNNKVWAAFEVANSETNQPNASYVPANLFGFNNSANAASPNGSTLNYLAGSTNGLSTNLAPDMLAKVAFEPGWGHYELKAVGRFFRDRINGSNNVNYGGGIGAAAILPLVPKRADFILEGLAGRGIGRYGAANGSDITLKPNGDIVPLRALHVMTGVELHPTPKLDVFFYGGDEYYGKAAYLDPTGLKAAGYGSPLVNNTNCTIEVVPSGAPACGAQNKNIWEASTGFWYKLAKGPYGTLQYGAQYEYLYRTPWSGVGGAPRGMDSVSFTSLRYFLP